jgi:hypothetical protein
MVPAIAIGQLQSREDLDRANARVLLGNSGWILGAYTAPAKSAPARTG